MFRFCCSGIEREATSFRAVSVTAVDQKYIQPTIVVGIEQSNP